MLNSGFVNQRAAIFAAELEKQYPAQASLQLSHGFQLATGRVATDEELTELSKLQQDLLSTYKLTPSTSLARICLLFLNLNETLYLD